MNLNQDYLLTFCGLFVGAIMTVLVTYDVIERFVINSQDTLHSVKRSDR